MGHDLSGAIRTYVSEQLDKKLDPHDKKIGKAQSDSGANPGLVVSLKQERSEIIAKYAPDVWLDSAAHRASQIDLGTHGTKFSNSDAKARGVKASIEAPSMHRVGTHSLSQYSLDAIGNAAALDVAVLLQISEEGEFLWEQISAGDPSSLKAFSNDNTRIEQWLTGLSQAVNSTDYVPHTLTKQVYFPVEGGGYHLISPLFATSLAQEIYETVQESRFSDAAKAAREARRSGTAHEHDTVQYMNTAQMKYGGSQPQNVSLLNSRRRGSAYLLGCAPPQWRSRLQVPVKGERSFWRMFERRSRPTVLSFRQFLERVRDHNNLAIRTTRGHFVEQLADEFLTLGLSIREIGDPGWSRQSDLPMAEQCFLDPHRRDDPDTPYAHMQSTGEWKPLLCKEFGAFVSRRLDKMQTRSGKESRDMSDAEDKEWGRELKRSMVSLNAHLDSAS